MGAQAGRRWLDMRRLAATVWRARPVAGAASDLSRGICACRRSGTHGPHRRRLDRPDPDRLWQRRPEAALFAWYLQRQRVVVPGLFRTQRRLRSRQCPDPCRAGSGEWRLAGYRSEGLDFSGARFGMDIRIGALRAGFARQSRPDFLVDAVGASRGRDPADPAA